MGLSWQVLEIYVSIEPKGTETNNRAEYKTNWLWPYVPRVCAAKQTSNGVYRLGVMGPGGHFEHVKAEGSCHMSSKM